MKYIFHICAGLLIPAYACTHAAAQTATPAQTPAASDAGMSSLKVPSGTSFFAKLTTPIVIGKASTDDTLEAQTTQDVKQGHDVLLKKGSTLVGHVHSVQPPTAERPDIYVVMVFDRVRPKNGGEMRLDLVIQALAPESDVGDSRSMADTTGTGMRGATRTAGVTGHTSATQGSINGLTTSSTGVYDIDGLQVGERTSGGTHYTVLASSRKDLQLKKGTQLVMKVVGQ